MWTLVGVVLVLVVGGGAFALGTIATRSDDADSVRTPVSAPTTAAADENAGKSSSSASPGTSAEDKAGLRVAKGLSTLISDSIKDKAAVGTAVASLDSCRTMRSSIRTLDDAARSRTDLVTRAKRVDTTGVSGAQDVVASLVRAWQRSAKADAAFADYGRSLHRNGKGKCVGNKSWRSKGVRLSAQSHPPKQAAAKAWNALAKKYGLATVEWAQL